MAAELEKMRRSGLLVYQILKNLGDMVQEGVGWFKDKGSTPLKVRVRVE